MYLQGVSKVRSDWKLHFVSGKDLIYLIMQMKVVSLVKFLFCKIQPWIISQIDRWIVSFTDNILPLKIKLNCSQLNGYKTKNKLRYSEIDNSGR